jgi:predicted PhzF superfamily epimerase YddE/YHI9
MAHTFFHVDVFGVAKYSGNQLAVFTDSSAIEPEKLQLTLNKVMKLKGLLFCA